MLRSFLLILTAVLLAVLLAGALTGWHTLLFAVVPAILLFGLLFERHVYKPIRREPPGVGWEKTSERFVDPNSGQTVAVYYNPRTGERRYIVEHEG